MPKPMDRIPKHDRPREKLLTKGPGALTDRDLLAVLLGQVEGVEVDQTYLDL